MALNDNEIVNCLPHIFGSYWLLASFLTDPNLINPEGGVSDRRRSVRPPVLPWLCWAAPAVLLLSDCRPGLTCHLLSGASYRALASGARWRAALNARLPEVSADTYASAVCECLWQLDSVFITLLQVRAAPPARFRPWVDRAAVCGLHVGHILTFQCGIALFFDDLRTLSGRGSYCVHGATSFWAFGSFLLAEKRWQITLMMGKQSQI